MQLVDAHCHFDFPVFEGRRQELWQRARQAGVSRLVVPGVRQPDWRRVQEVSAGGDDWWYCLGIHPWFVEEHGDRALADLDDDGGEERPAARHRVDVHGRRLRPGHRPPRGATRERVRLDVNRAVVDLRLRDLPN